MACPYPDSTPGEPSLRGMLGPVPDRVSRNSTEVAVKLRDRHGCVLGRPGVHVQALLEVRDDAGRESSVSSEVLLPEVRVRSQRGLQRGEEHRVSATPWGAKVSARRGDTSPRPEVGDAEREWRLLACQPIGLARTGVHRQAPPFRVEEVTAYSLLCTHSISTPGADYQPIERKEMSFVNRRDAAVCQFRRSSAPATTSGSITVASP